MTEPQAPPPVTGRGSPLSHVATLVVFVALILFLFNLSLRPSAWGGPRGVGPFETDDLPGAGWLARDARLGIEKFAAFRSPDRVLEATGEALTSYHALLSLARYVLLWILLRRLGGSGWLATLGVVAAALPMAFGAPRQYEADVGLLLFVILLTATTPARVPWWLAAGALPLLFAAWANAHSSVVIGLAWLGVTTVGRALDWWKARRRGEHQDPSWARLVLAIGLCAVAACLNPDGPKLFVDAFRVTKNPNIAALPDWQPVDFSRPAGMPWGYFATLAALLVVQLFSPRVLSATNMLVILTFGFWPLVQQRGLAYWWLIVPWLVVPMVARPVEKPDLRKVGPPHSIGRPRWIACLVVGIVFLCTPFSRWLLTGNPRELSAIVSADTPWRVARELKAEGADAGTYLPELRDALQGAYPSDRYRGAILCGMDQGDFLGWVLDGDNSQPVMLYTRPETFDPGHWAEAHRALDGLGDWWEITGRHQVNLVIIASGKYAKLAGRLRESKAWRTFQDGDLLVAVRREPKLPVELFDP